MHCSTDNTKVQALQMTQQPLSLTPGGGGIPGLGMPPMGGIPMGGGPAASHNTAAGSKRMFKKQGRHTCIGWMGLTVNVTMRFGTVQLPSTTLVRPCMLTDHTMLSAGLTYACPPAALTPLRPNAASYLCPAVNQTSSPTMIPMCSECGACSEPRWLPRGPYLPWVGACPAAVLLLDRVLAAASWGVPASGAWAPSCWGLGHPPHGQGRPDPAGT